MQTNDAAEVLLDRLLRAARQRRELFEGEMSEGDFEKFMLAVQRLGALTVAVRGEDIPLGIVGMAMDYYSRAIAHFADEAKELASARAAGSA